MEVVLFFHDDHHQNQKSNASKYKKIMETLNSSCQIVKIQLKNPLMLHAFIKLKDFRQEIFKMFDVLRFCFKT